MKRGERERVSADCITTKWLPLKQRFLDNFCLLGQGTIHAYLSVILPYYRNFPFKVSLWWSGGGRQARTI